MPANTATIITRKIHQLASDPASLANNVMQLKGSPHSRLRVADWRVVFVTTPTLLAVEEIGSRCSLYD